MTMYIFASGESLQQMRMALVNSPKGREMVSAGDVKLVWINEADLYGLTAIKQPFRDESLRRDKKLDKAVDRLIAARKVAEKLYNEQRHKEADAVRALCNTYAMSNETNSRLYHDNTHLRAMIAQIKPKEEPHV